MAKRVKRRRKKGTGTFLTDPRTGKPVWRRGYTDANGQKREIWLSAETDEELMQKVSNAQAALQSRTDPNITVDKYIPIYLSHKNNWKGKTYCNYKSVLLKKVKPQFAGVKIRDLTPRAIEDFVNSHITTNGNTTTALTYRRILSAMLGEAVRDRIILSNPVLSTKPPKNTNYKTGPKLISLQELKRLLLFAAEPKRVFAVTHPDSKYDSENLPGIVRIKSNRKKPPYNIGYDYLYNCYWTMILLAAKTGLRPGELRALKWNNFNEKGKFLQVTNAEGLNYNGQIEIQDPKSVKGKRTLVLDSETILYLNIWKKHQKVYAREVGSIYDNAGDLIFCGWKGEAIHWSNFTRRYFRPLLRHLKIADNVVFYGLRHLNVSVLLHATGDPEMVAQRVGHTDTGLVFNTYGHPLLNAQLAAVDATAKIITVNSIEEVESKETSTTDSIIAFGSVDDKKE